MKIKNIVFEDFNNYKYPSMLIGFSQCTFKCDKECGKQVCQNGTLAEALTFEINIDDIVSKYMDNNITSAIVCGGLEPFDSWIDLLTLVNAFRLQTDDDIVIYTGYNKDEIIKHINILKCFPNIIVKFGRYVPNQEKHYDEVLGVELVSDNQYAERIS